MDIMINSEVIKSIRKKKSWSQDHLAAIAGISLRTLQRIEREGKASLESRKALASALDLEPSDLLSKESSPVRKNYNPIHGYIGVFLGVTCSYAAVTYTLFQGQSSGFEAGSAYGIVGALAGLCCGIIGHYSKKA